jgi:CspA family cold shock protein
MPEGIVKWFNEKRGYGFIMQKGGGEVFVHYSSINTDGFKSLDEGERVHFDVQQGKKGLTATNVTKA